MVYHYGNGFMPERLTNMHFPKNKVWEYINDFSTIMSIWKFYWMLEKKERKLHKCYTCNIKLVHNTIYNYFHLIYLINKTINKLNILFL